jgi:DNA-binding MarR family transcriptional regulator
LLNGGQNNMDQSNLVELLAKIQIERQIQLTTALKKITSLDIRQVLVLKLIQEKKGLIQKDIADAINHRPASISALLQKLENEDLIYRQIPADNTRNKQIFLTEKGQEIVDTFEQEEHFIYERLISKIDNTQKSELIKLLTLAYKGLIEK